MNILLWHGFLLAGSGSNVYTANLARSWRGDGHDVLVLCQERNAGAFDFVDESGDFASDNRDWTTTSTGAVPARGRCVVIRPDIDALLPVYVYDDYEGFDVKLFIELTDHELETYTSRNVDAMVTAIERHRPDALITGHEVMGPSIALRACSRSGPGYLAKLHGSALEYAVKVQDRYRVHAREGLGGARVVVGGSRYMIAAAAEAAGGWQERAEVVNPGCDVELFAPAPADQIRSASVVYVGKLLASKGVHDLLAALGRTQAPDGATIIGRGGFEPELRELAQALKSGDRDAALAIARRDANPVLRSLVGFLSGGDVDEDFHARMKALPISFAGHLEHDELAGVLPTAGVLVVPSVVPEAFGMVAAEAAAAGVLPIVPGHSGIAEAGRAIEEAIGRPGLLVYDPARPIHGLAEAIDRVLGIPFEERRELGRAASELARRRWAWGRVADRLLRLAALGSGDVRDA